jgi:FKBP-type peptidyl-prolyl cis-trans isomerase 2
MAAQEIILAGNVPHATYQPIEGRSLAMGDYAVLTYSASLDGQPLNEAVPDAPPQLQGRRNAWIFMSEESLLPGFCQAIAGMNVNEEKTVSLELPADFGVASLAGKKLDYAVTLHAINKKIVPALDDELANKIDPGSTAEELEKKVRERLAITRFCTSRSRTLPRRMRPSSDAEQSANGRLKWSPKCPTTNSGPLSCATPTGT